MTRDEAIEKVRTIFARNPHRELMPHEAVEMEVDILVALGLLTLDEPKSVEIEAIEELTGAIVEAVNYTYPNGADRVRVTEHGSRQIVARLSRGGFKITKA